MTIKIRKLWVPLISAKTILVLSTVLLFISILTLYTLFAHPVFGLYQSLHNLDSLYPVIVDDMNPWNGKMLKALQKSKQRIKSSRNSVTLHFTKAKQSDKNVDRSDWKQRNGKFTFIVGLHHINKEYNKTISNLKAVRDTVNYTHPINAKCQHKGRVFALGIMKTGTTSMVTALKRLGYYCGEHSCKHQGNWFHFIDSAHLWQPIEVIVLSLLNMTDLFNDLYLAESMNALAFGDSPWCFLYPVWDKLYPDSKYILMTRKDDETYINSYLRYLKKFNKKYVNKGLTNAQFALIALRRYQLHNEMIREYFKHRPNDLLEIVVEDNNEWNDIIEFLGCDKPSSRFPHQNKSKKKREPNYNPIKFNINDEKWNWKKQFGHHIPYIARNKDETLSLKIVHKDEFMLDWNVFVVDELKVRNPFDT